jgi:signal transduction histidine kinase
MLRRISTKLMVAVLVTVVLPFVVFAIFIDGQMNDRLTRHVTQQALMGLAKDLAGQVDAFVEDRGRDVSQWVGARSVIPAIEDHEYERARIARARERGEEATLAVPPWDAETLYRWANGGEEPGTATIPPLHLRAKLTFDFDRYIDHLRVFDLIVLADGQGQLVTASSRAPDGSGLSLEHLTGLFATDFSGEEWFRRAREGRSCAVNQHRSPYAPPPASSRDGAVADPASAYQIGFASPVFSSEGEVRGVLLALVNWRYIQEIVSAPVVKDAFRGLVREDREPSPYAWIWDSDADTILAHVKREIYGWSIIDQVRLPQLTEAVRTSETGWGLYPEYEFGGKKKNAAFKRCRGEGEGGFGWVVGVGIDNEDIYATASELRRLLLGGTMVVLLMAVGWTFLISRRTTAPILELQRYTRRVAQGDLDAQVKIRSKDELGALAADFNQMTREIKEQRARIVKAEKDAAWREMARQIAHDIKNPLTPIQLSLDLLDRARREDAPNRDEILDRTMELVRRQVENLVQIARDFYEFTGGRTPRPEAIEVMELIEEVLHLHDAWAVQLGVQVQAEGKGSWVHVDRGNLRRVFVNLASNALQAMLAGGRLDIEVVREGRSVRVSFRDTGVGIAEEVRAHLFEPYFTTKGEGSGLGLAISRRMLDEMGGEITLSPISDARGEGTIATVILPASDPAAASDPSAEDASAESGGE